MNQLERITHAILPLQKQLVTHPSPTQLDA